MAENATSEFQSDTTRPAPREFVANAHVDAERHAADYARSIDDPEGFWAEQGRRIDWIEPFTKVKNANFTFGEVSIRWYEDGVLNVSAN